MANNSRSALLVVHPHREEALETAEVFIDELKKADFALYSNIELSNTQLFNSGINVEIAIVLGGDGTTLRAAELVKEQSAPILGINLGHVGFLAEVEKLSNAEILKAIIAKDYNKED